MLITSKDASKLLKQLEEEKESVKREEDSAYTFIAATIENVEEVRPEYNFKETRKKQDALNSKIIALKHAINCFNTKTVVPEFGMTIDEMLVYIPFLTQRKNKLDEMLSYPKKIRLATRGTNIIEYKYANFDREEVRAMYDSVVEELTKAQVALDRVNISATFEVNL